MPEQAIFQIVKLTASYPVALKQNDRVCRKPPRRVFSSLSEIGLERRHIIYRTSVSEIVISTSTIEQILNVFVISTTSD